MHHWGSLDSQVYGHGYYKWHQMEVHIVRWKTITPRSHEAVPFACFYTNKWN